MTMRIGIVAGGPREVIPNLQDYYNEIDKWIGADLGALYLLEANLPIAHAIGDFDSMNEENKQKIKEYTTVFQPFPIEKDETDLELAVDEAMKYQPATILLFGVTAGRLDHELANIQLLYRLLKKGYKGKIVDHKNELTILSPGTYPIMTKRNELISFIPLSPEVFGITLTGFYYPLKDKTLMWGSTRCISNQLINEEGMLSFTHGYIIMIKSTEHDKHKWL